MDPLRYREDVDLMPDLAAAQIRAPHKLAKWVLIMVGFGLAVFVGWASMTDLPEVTKGDGKVIPSKQNQIVQHIRGGIVTDILVKEGDVVKAGQVLLRIQNRDGKADYDEKRSDFLSLSARASRLEAQAQGRKKIRFSRAVLRGAPKFAAQQRKVFRSRRVQVIAELGVLRQQLRQREQLLKEQRSLVASLTKRVASLSAEVGRAQPMVRRGAVSRLEFLRLQRDLSDARGELRTESLKIPRYQAGIRESRQKVQDKRNESRAKVLQELTEVRSKMSELEERMRQLYFEVSRTDVRSPVRGTIKQLRISTKGGVVKPGEPLVEIVPLEDSLLIEAKIRPSDRAFLKIGQNAVIKITAYDYNIYGGLKGKVVSVSADTIEESNRPDEAFYKVQVRTSRSFLEKDGKRLPIIPGMTAVVNIMTGQEKSILDYIMKPITKSQRANRATVEQ
jgi:adhesin transport system membrane fusion protein